MEEKTKREKIREALIEQEWDFKSLARNFQMKVQEIEQEIHHIQKSVDKEYVLKTEPAICESCDYVFASRKKLRSPSRCPKCKQERIIEATVQLVKKTQHSEVG